MLGIDLSRHNPVTDWSEVRRHGVGSVYIKATDGGGLAPGQTAENKLRGATVQAIPAGLYHYAQLSPSPEAQADVLANEARRLAGMGLSPYGLPPALDLEAPHQPGGPARDFAQRFLLRLRDRGFTAVTLYANTSMLNGIQAWTLDVPNLVFWAANYGPNDGAQHPLPKPWSALAHIHQYTSAGTVPGIVGLVDLNDFRTKIPDATGDTDMPLDNEDLRKVTDDTRIQVLTRDGAPAMLDTGAPYLVSLNEATGQNNRAVWWAVDNTEKIMAKLDALAGTLSDDEANIIREVRMMQGGDVAALAAALAPLLGPLVQAGATPEQVREATDKAIRAAFARAGTEQA